MAIQEPHFSNQFCADIENQAKMHSRLSIQSIKSDLQLYDDNDEKLDIFKSKLNEIRKNLEGNEFKRLFSVDNIKANLNLCLKLYFKRQIMSLATQMEYNESITRGEIDYNSETQTIIVYPLPWYQVRDKKFDFGLLNIFSPLVEYIGWGLSFLELREIETKIKNNKNPIKNKEGINNTPIKKTNSQIKKKSIFPSKRAFTKSDQIGEDKKLMEITYTIPQTDADQNGPIMMDQLSTKENRNTSKEKPLNITSEDKQDEVPNVFEKRQHKTTIDFLIGNESEKQNLLEYLKKNFAGSKGKKIAIMILTLKEMKLISPIYKTELYAALEHDLGSVGSDEGINKILREASRKEENILELVSLQVVKLRNHIDNLP